jgi:peptide-methionine (S)-S-oxide reductase
MEENTEIAVFGGGCFWCTEAVFAQLDGVESVMPGYSGGHTENPTYYEVCDETTGHAEVTKVQFDPNRISYQDLLEVFFATHDPTTLNRQGADRGYRYRSIILYANEEQKEQAEAYMRKLNASGEHRDQVVTLVEQLGRFYDAEPEHKEYYLRNAASMYCQLVISPKVIKVRDKFAKQVTE